MHIAVHRHQNTVWYKPIGVEEFRLLSALEKDNPLGAAIDKAFDGSEIPEGQRPAFLQEAFANWAMLGWFTH
jgi:hypothetical protein